MAILWYFERNARFVICQMSCKIIKEKVGQICKENTPNGFVNSGKIRLFEADKNISLVQGNFGVDLSVILRKIEILLFDKHLS